MLEVKPKSSVGSVHDCHLIILVTTIHSHAASQEVPTSVFTADSCYTSHDCYEAYQFWSGTCVLSVRLEHHPNTSLKEFYHLFNFIRCTLASRDPIFLNYIHRFFQALYWSDLDIYFGMLHDTFPLPIIVDIGTKFWNWGHVIFKICEAQWKRKMISKIKSYSTEKKTYIYETHSFKGVYNSQNLLYQWIDVAVTLKAYLADYDSVNQWHFT